MLQHMTSVAEVAADPNSNDI